MRPYRRLSAGRVNIVTATETATMAFARKTAGQWREDLPGARRIKCGF